MRKDLARDIHYACLMGVACALLAGCSTTKSIDVSQAAEKDRKGAYINYSVPKSLFTIQISAASPAQTAANGNGDSSKGNGNGGGSSSSSSSSSRNGSESGGGTVNQADDASRCAVMLAQYADAQRQVAAQLATYNTLKVALSQMATGQPGAEDTPKTLASKVADYRNAITGDTYQALLRMGDGIPAVTLPDGAILQQRIPGLYDNIIGECPPRVAVQVQHTVVPDTSKTFALKPRTNIFYSDTLAIGTDANGFLTNAAPSSTSQITAIASAVANTAGLATPQRQAIFPIARGVGGEITACSSAVVSDPAQQVKDLALCPDPKSAASLALQLFNDLETPGSLPSLPAANLPITIYAHVDELEEAPPPSAGAQPNADPAPRTAMVAAYNKAVLDAFGLKITLDCSPRRLDSPPLPGGPENIDAADSSRAGRPKGVYDGLIVSAPRACLFQTSQMRPSQDASGAPVSTIIARAYYWVQDSRYLTVLPTERGFLVQRSVTYSFANGQATGVSDNRPSEALAFVSFPGTVVGSFFQGVTSAATNGQALTNGRTAELNAQTNYITAQTNYITAEQKLKTITSAPQK